MDFGFTEEQRHFRDTIKAFVARKVLPGYVERARRTILDRDVIKAAAELGLPALAAMDGEPDYIAWGIAVEEMARGDFNHAQATVVTPALTLSYLEAIEDPDVRERWVDGVYTGDVLFGTGITEPEAGTDVGRIRTTAVLDGDEWVLNGEKNSVSYLHAPAYVMFAKTSEPRGITAFLVPADASGLALSELDDLGMRPLGRGSVFMDDVRIPLNHVIGTIDKGFSLALSRFDFLRTLVSLSCVGAALQSLDETYQYVQEREQFGVPIGSFQAVSFKLAEHATAVEAARLLCYKALWMYQVGEPVAGAAAMAKLTAPDTAAKAIWACLETHGHYGYTDQFPFSQRFRDVLGLKIGDGTDEAQKMVISRHLLGRRL